jgi:mercuric reductase
MKRLRMQVDGMTCDSCSRRVEQALARAGALEPKADWRRGLAVFTSEAEPDYSVLSDALADAGYEARGFERLDPAQVKRDLPNEADYDLLMIGGGSAAFAAAIRATNLDARVAIVERSTIGGTCVNVGCIPSKNLLAASEAYRQAGHHPFAGIRTHNNGVQMGGLMGMKHDVVTMLQREKYTDLADLYGFEIIRGNARFMGPDSVEVDGRRITAGHFVIASGSAPWTPPIEGLEGAGYLTSTTAMELKKLPKSLIVIGGNYIGLEMGQLFSNLGSRVTVVESLDRIAPMEEPEISEWMTTILAEEGIKIATSAQVVRVEGGEKKAVIARFEGSERRFEADEILIATGRRPVLDGLGLDRAGIELTDRGLLVLDDELRTTNPKVFAAGDVTGAPQFVYVAAAQGTVAAGNAVGSTLARWTTSVCRG